MKRVLVVYHSFDEWEMGPIRLRRIVRNLPAAGYEPVVLTSEKSARTAAEIPEGLTCLRAGGVDLAELYRKAKGSLRKDAGDSAAGGSSARNNRLTSIVNRWLMVPDKQVTWKNAALKTARAYLKDNPVDVIFASLAPRTNLLVAAALAKEFNIPCVMEFRDLWTGSPYYHLTQPTAVHRQLHRRLERRVIRQATRVTAVCRGLADYLQNAYADDLREPVALNYNFYDPSEYPEQNRTPGRRPMTVSYIGAMYASRSPISFFNGLKKFVKDNGLSPDDVQFRWAGQVIGVAGVEEAIANLALEPFIERLGQLSHGDALKELCGSDASVLIQAPGDSVHIPGKLFEAIGASVPVLTIADEGEIRDIVQATHGGVVCPHTEEGIAGALLEFWNHHRTGQPWPFNEREREAYRADRAVGQIADLLDSAQSHDQ